MFRKFCLLALTFSLLGCAAAFVPATSDPEQKLRYAWELLTVYRPIPARKLIDESIEIYKQQGKTEELCQAYLWSSHYHRFLASKEYQQLDLKEPPLHVKPVHLYEVLKYTSNDVLAAHKLAVGTCEQALAEAASAQDHFKARRAYHLLAALYMSNAQYSEACKALDAELEQYHLAKTADPGRKFSSNVEEENQKTKKLIECDKR